MASWLWGLWLRRLIRDAKPGVPWGAFGGWSESGTARGEPAVRSGGGWPGSRVAAVRSDGIDGGLMDNAILAGTDDVRWPQAGGVALPIAHELSCQKEGRGGAGRGRVSSVIIAPPQQGQRSSGGVETASSAGAIIGAGAGMSSSIRHNASFAARWPLARKP